MFDTFFCLRKVDRFFRPKFLLNKKKMEVRAEM